MSSKAALKAVRTALDAKDFGAAAEKAKAVVQNDPKNYHACVPLSMPNNLTLANRALPFALATFSSDLRMTN
jgi:superkiller protein 3